MERQYYSLNELKLLKFAEKSNWPSLAKRIPKKEFDHAYDISHCSYSMKIQHSINYLLFKIVKEKGRRDDR